jgi:hypothetical protein
MGKWIKRVAKVLGAVVLLGGGGLAIFAYTQTSAYDASMNKVYDVPPLALVRSTDPAAIARGDHLTHAFAACAIKDCHGGDFGGGKATEMGPIGTLAPPNVTNILPAYTDGELARLIRHGIKKDGRSVCFMPVDEINWLPDSDIVAIISYLRTVPPVDRANAGTTVMKTLGKVLDRKGDIPADIARRIDHTHVATFDGPPTPTAEYGKLIGRACLGCHGAKLSGGRIPGTPKKIPAVANITPDATGLAGYTYDDFDKEIQTAIKKNGQPMDPFMPVEALRGMNDLEKHALFAYLQSVPPVPYGNR